FEGNRKPFPQKNGGNPGISENPANSGFSGGRERELVGRLISRVLAVRAARTARLGAGAERFVDNGLDGTRAAAAFGAAAEAPVDLLCIARQIRRRQVRSCANGTADIMVAEDVTGTDNHEDGGRIGDAWTLRY